MAWLQIMIAMTSLGARRIAVAATYGHLKRRSGLEPDREFIPTSVVMEKTLIPSMFPSTVCPQTNMLLRSLDLPVNGMFWVLTREGYVLTQQLLARAGLRFLPPLDVVQQSCPDGVLRRPDGVPCLICPPLDDPSRSPSTSASIRARDTGSAAALDDDAALISDIQNAGHVAMDADFAAATALHSFAAAYASTVTTMLFVIAIELLALGIPFAVRGALGEPLLGRSLAEGATFLLVALGQAAVSLNVGSGLSGAMTLYFLTTAAAFMSRRGTFPPPTIKSADAQATSIAIVADATGVSIDSGTPLRRDRLCRSSTWGELPWTASRLYRCQLVPVAAQCRPPCHLSPRYAFCRRHRHAIHYFSARALALSELQQ